MADKPPLSDDALELVAARFRCLSEPIRLKILRELQSGEANVGDLVKRLHASQANVSKHLRILVDAGVLTRRAQGTSAFYSISDPLMVKLCETVCNALTEQIKSKAEVLGLKVGEPRNDIGRRKSRRSTAENAGSGNKL